MPISIAKLEAAQRPLSDQIFQFLQERSDKAFTLVEIYSELNSMDLQVVTVISLFSPKPSETLERWKNAAEQLVDSGKLRRAMVGGVTYYGIASK